MGLMDNLMLGALEAVSPQAAYIKRQQIASAQERNRLITAAKNRVKNQAFTDYINNSGNNALKAMAAMSSMYEPDEFNVDELGKQETATLNHLQQAVMPTNRQKDVNAVFDPNLPESQREMVRQDFMKERPHDIRELDIKQQNADTMQSYRKAQAAAVPKVSSRTGAMKTDMSGNMSGGLNKDQYIDENGNVRAYSGSKVDIDQRAEFSKSKTALDVANSRLQETISTINRIQNHPGFKGNFGTIVSGMTRYFNKDSRDLAPEVDRLINMFSNQGLEELRKSGVAPGSITEKEWPIMGAMMANLRSYISDGKPVKDDTTGINIDSDQTAYAILERVKQRLKETMAREKATFDVQWSGTQYGNDGGSGNGQSIIPSNANNARPVNVSSKGFPIKEGTYSYTEDRTVRHNSLTGELQAISDDGKSWLPAKAVVGQDGSAEIVVGDEPALGTTAPTETKPKKIVKQAKDAQGRLWNLYEDGSEGLADGQ